MHAHGEEGEEERERKDAHFPSWELYSKILDEEPVELVALELPFMVWLDHPLVNMRTYVCSKSQNRNA